MTFERPLHVGEKSVDDEGALRQIDEMRTVIGELARQRRGRGQESGVAAHDNGAIDAFEGRIVEIGAGEGLGHEARGGRKARDMIEADQIVVDRLRHVHGAKLMVPLLGLVRDDAHGVGRVVAADVEERVDLMRLQDLEDLLAIFQVGFVARRSERGGRRPGDRLQIADCLLAEIDKIVIDDAPHPVPGAVDGGDVREAAGFERDSNQGLIDDRGRPPALSDKDLVRHEAFLSGLGECERL